MRDKIRGGMVGLLVGDALGVPYEFNGPKMIPERKMIEFKPPKGFRASHNVPPGTYSDDGAQALALADSLIKSGNYDFENFAGKLVDWRYRGEYAVDSQVFDIGIQSSYAISRLRAGLLPEPVKPGDDSGNGNGSLMRVLPLALWHRGIDEELIRDACDSSKATHPHPRSQACCALYCMWARMILVGSADPWLDAVDRVTGSHYLFKNPRVAHEIQNHIPLSDHGGSGTGYVVDCLCSASWAVRVGTDYESTVKAAISLGNDTDTTACVAGGIAGIMYGEKSIPARWRNGLRGKEIWKPIVAGMARGR